MKPAEKLDITLAKGLAITLVVVGHILSAGGSSEGNAWFTTLTDYIYLFHMPFFLFLSGYVFFKPGRLERISQHYTKFLSTQAVRLLLPFFFMGVVIVTGKLVMQHFVHVANVPENPMQGFIDLLWHTKKSASVFLWYIFALFVYGALAVPLFRLLGSRMALWVALGFVVFLIPPIPYLYLEKLTAFFLFFCIGGAAIVHDGRYLAFIDRHRNFLLCMLLFVASFLLFEYHAIPHRWNVLLTGLLCIPVLHRLCRVLAAHKNNAVELFLLLGRCSYSIYLLNTICIGVAKGVIFKVTDWNYWHFYLILPVLVTAGLLGPVIAEWLVLRRIPFVRERILGK